MFDSGYLARGLALVSSMRANGILDSIWILCLDEVTRTYLERLALPKVHLLSTEDLEAAVPGLVKARDERTRAEYFFTCTPALVATVLTGSEKYDWVTYLDADMYFYDNPGRVFETLAGFDVAIVPHRFPDNISSLSKYGTYNVAWVMFKSTRAGIDCAEWWRAQCLEWCFDRPEEGRYADQGYLDEFASRFPTTAVISDAGINVAPWNLGRHTITWQESEGTVYVDGQTLIFFHFHGLRRRGDWYYPSLATYKTHLDAVVRDRVYAPYLSMLLAIEGGSATVNVAQPIPQLTGGTASRNQKSLRSTAYRGRRRLVNAVERITGNAFRMTDLEDDPTRVRRYS